MSVNTEIHPSAIVSKHADIGVGVQIGPFSVIEEGVQIGDHSIIKSHAVIYRGTTLGSGCHVHPQAVIGDTPQDLTFQESETYVKIGSHCVFRECVTVHRGTKEGSSTVVGDDCFIMACSHVAHNVKLGNQVVLANGALLGGYVEIGDQVFVAGVEGIHQFVRVGRLAMVGGGGGVSKDVPPFCTVHSVRLNEVSGLNSIGLKRAGLNPDERKEVKRAFDFLYNSSLNVTQAVEHIKEQCSGPFVEEFVQFIESSKRGICQRNRTSRVEC